MKIACNARTTRHTALEFYTTAFDASADRQEAFHGGASRYRAFQIYIQAGRDTGGGPLKVFQLVQGEYEHIERTLRQDDVLWGFVDDKIRFVNLRHGKDYS